MKDSKDTKYIRQVCDFSCDEQLCHTLDKAGVPPDGKWRTQILFMRGINDFKNLSDGQKAEMQSLVMDVLRNGDYSEDRYTNLIREQERILNSRCNERLKAALQETADFLEEFSDIVNRRRNNVEELGEETIDLIRKGGDPEIMVANLNRAFREVVDAMEQDVKTLSELSRTDQLTGLNNRRSFDEFLRAALTRWESKGSPVTLLMIDIDHFKDFNDTFGHRIGDQALATVAKIIRQCGENLMVSDGSGVFSARYGGEEFAVVLPGGLLLDGEILGEQIREMVEKYNFIIRDTDGNIVKRGIRLTVSIGVAEVDSEWKGAYAENIIDAADRAMYLAKSEGRNKLRSAPRLKPGE